MLHDLTIRHAFKHVSNTSRRHNILDFDTVQLQRGKTRNERGKEIKTHHQGLKWKTILRLNADIDAECTCSDLRFNTLTKMKRRTFKNVYAGSEWYYNGLLFVINVDLIVIFIFEIVKLHRTLSVTERPWF